MIEPVSASIAVYLITKGTKTIKRDKRLIEKNPYYIKKKFCKLISKNREEIINLIIDETNDYIMDSFNLIHLKYINPSIFLIIYMLLIIVTNNCNNNCLKMIYFFN
jgi:hypothetical protein